MGDWWLPHFSPGLLSSAVKMEGTKNHGPGQSGKWELLAQVQLDYGVFGLSHPVFCGQVFEQSSLGTWKCKHRWISLEC